MTIGGGMASTILIYWGCNKIEKLKLGINDVLVWIEEVSLVFLCLHLIDLDIPLRGILGLNNTLSAIIFDFTFCVLGTILISQFKVTRKIFGVTKISKLSQSNGI